MDYINKFDEYLCRCEIQENEAMILSRFRIGLRDELRREVLIRDVSTLHDAYELVRNYESLTIPSKRFTLSPRPSTFTQTNPGSTSSHKVNEPEKGKSTYGSNIQCYQCREWGHTQNKCPKNPKNVLVIEENIEDLEIEAEHVLEGECSEDEYSEHLNVIREIYNNLEPPRTGNMPPHVSVVRCVFSVPQQTDD